MNCDEAFDALTDPTESNQSALKWHLEFCPRCREMQQVLAPAIAMFAGNEPRLDDATSTRDRQPELPIGRKLRFSRMHAANRPQPFLTPEAIKVAEQSAQALHPRRKHLAVRWMMAGVVLATTALAVFFAIRTTEPGVAGSNSTMLADHCLWTERDAAEVPMATQEASSRWVVLSCVACHLENSLD